MEDNKRIAELEQHVKKLLHRLVNLETQGAKDALTIRMLKRRVSDLETNVDFLSRRK
jgi:uncharacterized coiled-coil protein SlyX